MSKTVALISNEHSWTYNLRRETIQALLDGGYRVVLILPYGEKVELLKQMGCEYEDVPMFERRGMNPFKELSLIRAYRRILKRIRPDVVLTYTLKPNVYGGMAAARLKIPYIANITGLGTAGDMRGIKAKLIWLLYKRGFRRVHKVFFQNEENRKAFAGRRIAEGRHGLIPGSGVNLERFSPLPYPKDDTIEFVFISRVMKEKGIEEYLEAVQRVRSQYPGTVFHVCGFCEQEYDGPLKQLQEQGAVVYHGMVDDIRTVLARVHCVVLPSYHEGMSNVLLESAASARPLIASNVAGCREAIEDGVNGYTCEVRSADSLANAMKRFLTLSYEQKMQMGIEGRRKAEREFDRTKVVDAYMNEIHQILK